jgi:Fic family protein
MKSFEKKYLENLKFQAEILSNLRAIGEYKGREDLYAKQSAETLEKLLESAIIESTESSNRIEGVTAPVKRIKMIVKDKTTPRNRSEQEIAGYRKALDLIHQSHENIPLSENVILQFHSTLYRYTDVKAGFWKKMDNLIIDRNPDGTQSIRFKPVSAQDTAYFINRLIFQYNDYLQKESFDPLVLIPLFIFDFLCIHPFKDGNGRIGRLLTLLLLYQSGYKVGKYISLERIIEETKSSYYDALSFSSQGWHKGEHDIFPWIEYFYGMLISAYKEFEMRFGIFKGKGSKTEQVKAQIERFVIPFSISDLEKSCPNITRDMIRRILHQLRDAQKIKSTGIGRGAKWIKTG